MVFHAAAAKLHADIFSVLSFLKSKKCIYVMRKHWVSAATVSEIQKMHVRSAERRRSATYRRGQRFISLHLWPVLLPTSPLRWVDSAHRMRCWVCRVHVNYCCWFLQQREHGSVSWRDGERGRKNLKGQKRKIKWKDGNILMRPFTDKWNN